MKKFKKFFKDAWKILLAIFIVTASLLYALIFDGSEMFFAVTFTACLVILFLKTLKNLTNTIKVFIYLKKSGVITGEDKKENVFWHKLLELRTVLFIMAGWILGKIIYIIWEGIN